MISPVVRPAFWAGEPSKTPTISTPAPLDASWTEMPTNADGPIWMVREAFLASMSAAMARAMLIGMANPSSPVICIVYPLDAAVSMPITWPLALIRGPPESPGWIAASVWSMLESCSLSPSGSVAVIDWPKAVTDPLAVLGLPPTPPALPIATTVSPTETLVELP